MKLKFLISAALSWTLTAHSESLTWNQALTLAEKNNADLQTSLAKWHAAQELEGYARGGYLPQLNGALNFNRSGRSDLPSTDSYTASLTASQNLFNGLQDLAKVRQAEFNTVSAEADLATTRAQLSYQLKSAYQSSLYAQAYLEFTKKVIGRREENFKMVRLRFEGGRENKGSVLLSQANLEQAKYDHVVANDAAQVAQAQLRKALGLDLENSTGPVWESLESIPLQNPPSTRPDMQRLASLTPSERKAFALEESARQGVRVARSGYFPTLNVSGTIGKLDSQFWPDHTDTWTVGVTLSLPIFNGGKDYHNTRSAAETWAAAETSRISNRRDLIAQLELAYSNYVEGVAKAKVDETFRQAALVRAEIARKQYDNGLISFQDWDAIENDLINRERNFLQSNRDRVLNEAAWEQAQGKGALHEN